MSKSNEVMKILNNSSGNEVEVFAHSGELYVVVEVVQSELDSSWHVNVGLSRSKDFLQDDSIIMERFKYRNNEYDKAIELANEYRKFYEIEQELHT